MQPKPGNIDDAANLALVRWSLLLAPLQRFLAAEKIAEMLPADRTRDRRRELKHLRMTLYEIRRRKA